MQKVITAMNEPEFNKKMKKKYTVIGKDIQYKEGILEILENNKDIEIIFFNNNLEGEIENNELFKIIEKINPKIEIKKYSEKIKEKNKKEIILEKNKKTKTIKIREKDREEIIEKKNKTTCSIYGEEGSGKTIISAIISKKLSKNKKVVLIDFNKEYNFFYLFNIQKEKELKNITIIEKEKIKENKNYLNKIENIIIDIGNKINKKEKEKILKKCDKNIIILQPNILSIKKVKKIIEIYTKEFKIERKKIFILINKKNKNSINKEVIKNIFKEIKIIGEIPLTDNFERLINNNFKNIENIDVKIKKELNKIINKINN